MITIRATDHAGLTKEEPLTVSVKPVNDAPVVNLTQTAFTMQEGNNAANTLNSLPIPGVSVSDVDVHELTGQGALLVTLTVLTGC